MAEVVALLPPVDAEGDFISAFLEFEQASTHVMLYAASRVACSAGRAVFFADVLRRRLERIGTDGTWSHVYEHIAVARHELLKLSRTTFGDSHQFERTMLRNRRLASSCLALRDAFEEPLSTYAGNTEPLMIELYAVPVPAV